MWLCNRERRERELKQRNDGTQRERESCHPSLSAACYCSRGVNGKLSQETTHHDNGSFTYLSADLSAPCPRYKCHLSPNDGDRKPRRAGCRKQTFEILTATALFISFFFCVCFFYFIILWVDDSPSSPSLFYPPTHMGTNTSTLRQNASSSILLSQRSHQGAWHFFFPPFHKNLVIVIPRSPHCLNALKDVRPPQREFIAMHEA